MSECKHCRGNKEFCRELQDNIFVAVKNTLESFPCEPIYRAAILLIIAKDLLSKKLPDAKQQIEGLMVLLKTIYKTELQNEKISEIEAENLINKLINDSKNV